MRIVMGVDMEGITGICCREMTMHEGRFAAEGVELMIGDINAAVAGLVDAGVDDIAVWDCHWMSFNVPLTKLHPAARYMRGGAPNNLRWPLLEEGVDGMILLGYHARAGTLHAVLEHTMSSESWHRLRVNGREIGEVGIDASLAGSMGVPVIMVSGDDKLCAEARELLGDIVAVEVKQGLARHGAVCLPPARTAELLRAGAREAVGRIGRVKPLDLGSPVEVELTHKHTWQADAVDLRHGNGRRVDGYTVRWTCPDLPSWWGYTMRNPPPRG